MVNGRCPLLSPVAEFGRKAELQGFGPSSAETFLISVCSLGCIKLRVQVQLKHPQILQAALVLAVRRENVAVWLVWTAKDAAVSSGQATGGCSSAGERPAWVQEERRLLSCGTARGPRPGPTVCWGCGQLSHLVRDCPRARQSLGNGRLAQKRRDADPGTSPLCNLAPTPCPPSGGAQHDGRRSQTPLPR